jgi:hypothetical protein
MTMPPDSTQLTDRTRIPEPERQLPAPDDDGRDIDVGDPGRGTSLVGLLREFAEDTRMLVQQEIALAKMEAAHTAKRVAIDGAWIGAGAAVVAVGGLCLVLALALGLGALLGSYWLGTLITGLLLLLVGGLIAWRGVHDLKKGGFAPTDTVESLKDDKDWAQHELDDFKRGIRKEQA